MQLENSFTVPVGVDEAWAVLLDINQVAPCMPGAAIDSVDGDDFTGTVKVKLGPISLTYKGKASFVEKDEAAHRAVIDARGRDARGNGTAAAKVTATLSAAGDEATRVAVTTELDITGKPAQFGRGVMVDVGNKLIGQFADNLATQLAGGDDSGDDDPGTSDSGATPDSPPDSPSDGSPTAGAAGRHAEAAGERSDTAARPPARDVEPIDLIESAGPAIAKRVAPIAAGLILVSLLARRRRRRRAS